MLAFGQFENPSFLKRDKPVVFLRMAGRPVLEYLQVFHRSENPLVVGIKHPFCNKLVVVVKEAKREFCGVFVKPFQYKTGPDQRKGRGGHPQGNRRGLVAQGGQECDGKRLVKVFFLFFLQLILIFILHFNKIFFKLVLDNNQ